MRFSFTLLSLIICSFSASAQASFPEVVIVGEDHIDETSVAFKRRAIENAAQGDSWLLLEGFYQSDRTKLEADLKLQGVERNSQIEGLETQVPYALGVMFKLHEDLSALLTVALKPGPIDPSSHQVLDHIREGFVDFFYENDVAFESWRRFQETPIERVGHETEINNLRNAINQRPTHVGPVIVRGLIHQDSELMRRVFQFQNYVRRFAGFLALDQAQRFSGSTRETLLRYASFFSQMGVARSATQGVWLDWRNQEFARKAIESYPKARSTGVPLVLIVGQLHVEGVEEILRSRLPTQVRIKIVDSRGPLSRVATSL